MILQAGEGKIARSRDDAAELVRHVRGVFAQHIDFRVDRRFRIHAQFELARLQPIDECMHAPLDVKRRIRRSKFGLHRPRKLFHQLHGFRIHIQSNEDTDFFHILHGWIHPEESARTEITDEDIKKLCVAFQDVAEAAVQIALWFVREKFQVIIHAPISSHVSSHL